VRRFVTAGKTRLKTAPPFKKRKMAHYNEFPVDKATYDLLPEMFRLQKILPGNANAPLAKA